MRLKNNMHDSGNILNAINILSEGYISLNRFYLLLTFQKRVKVVISLRGLLYFCGFITKKDLAISIKIFLFFMLLIYQKYILNCI
jgi:hypothetical protein